VEAKREGGRGLRDSHGRDAGGDLGPEEVDDGVEAGERVQLQLGRRLLQHREEPASGAHGRHRRHGRPDEEVRGFVDVRLEFRLGLDESSRQRRKANWNNDEREVLIANIQTVRGGLAIIGL
jgi:hypothetical protein